MSIQLINCEDRCEGQRPASTKVRQVGGPGIIWPGPGLGHGGGGFPGFH